MRIFQPPGAVRGIAPAGSPASAQHAQDAHVVFDGWDPRSRRVADHVLKRLDVAITLRALSQHDRRMFFTIDMTGGKKWRCDAIHANAVLSRQIAQPCELLNGGIETAIRNLRIAANIPNSVAGEILKMLLIARGALASQFHKYGFRRRR